MKRCFGCFELIDDALETCPRCGYKKITATSNSNYLTPGTLLSNRYIIGKVINSDNNSINYVAFDNSTNQKVKIREFFPSEYAVRFPNSNNICPKDPNYNNVFNAGFQAFVQEAKQLFNGTGSTKLYDCVGENGTAYMIMEYSEHKTTYNGAFAAPNQQIRNQRPAVNPVNTVKEEPKSDIKVLKPENKQNRSYNLMRDISLVPVWLKILFPSVFVVGIVLIILLSTGVIKFKYKTEEMVETAVITTTVSETTTETTPETTLEPEVDALVMTYNDHTYAVFNNADTWDAAEKYCEYVGGHLAVITSREENDAVWAFVSANNCETVFMGLSDLETDGEWKWVNGEPFVFSNWYVNQPDGLDTEYYGEYLCGYPGGKWNDNAYNPRTQEGGIHFICEWDRIVIGTTNLTLDDVTALLPDDFFNYRVLSLDQAKKAFEYHIAEDLITKNNINTTKATWGFEKQDGDKYRFYYSTASNLYVTYEMDINTGTTTSTTYVSSTSSDICGEGEYDFNAWDYLYDPDIQQDDVEYVDVQSFMGKDIYASVNSFDDISEDEVDTGIQYSYEYVTLYSSKPNNTSNIDWIGVYSYWGPFSIYGAVPGMTWYEALYDICAGGANSVIRIDDYSIKIIMNDGNTVTLTWDNGDSVTGIVVSK